MLLKYRTGKLLTQSSGGPLPARLVVLVLGTREPAMLEARKYRLKSVKVLFYIESYDLLQIILFGFVCIFEM